MTQMEADLYIVSQLIEEINSQRESIPLVPNSF